MPSPACRGWGACRRVRQAAFGGTTIRPKRHVFGGTGSVRRKRSLGRLVTGAREWALCIRLGKVFLSAGRIDSGRSDAERR